ncbi:MAG: TetR/AcrR family transcriptional regulator [Lachnospiraceae bacterium]
MNAGKTSKEAILAECREIVAEKGLAAVNMRSVAQSCGIALGTLYNYYENKEELLLSTVESVWMDIFHGNWKDEMQQSFFKYIKELFACVQEGTKKYPNFFTAHAVSLADSKEKKAQNTMEAYFCHIRSEMLLVLKKDPKVRAEVFSEQFSAEDFIAFVFDNILLLLMRQQTDCNVLLEVIRRTIYDR